MTNAKTFVDVEKPVRDWLRAQSLTGIGTRVFLGLPERCAYPAADISLIDGGIMAGTETPLADCRFTMSVWGGARPATAAASWELASALENMTPGTALDAPTTCYGMGGRVILGPLYRPDPNDNKPRYILDFVVTVRPA